MVYSAPGVRLDQAAEKLGAGKPVPASKEGDVSVEEMRNICDGRAALILDARPEVFYRVGHIPSALSLPRDDFEGSYHVLSPCWNRVATSPWWSIAPAATARIARWSGTPCGGWAMRMCGFFAVAGRVAGENLPEEKL